MANAGLMNRQQAGAIGVVPPSKPQSIRHGGDEYLIRKEAAEYLRISPAQISNLVHGRVPGMPQLRSGWAGRRMIFKRRWLDEFLEATATGGGANDTI
jgi:hypothetical protein